MPARRTTTLQAREACPCGTARDYAACCGRFLSRRSQPDTAEELMRSRYTAYVAGDIDYILDTHAPETVGTTDRESAAEWSERAAWLGLEVIGAERGQHGDTDGIVEFIARYAMEDRIQAHHERSRFEKRDGRWWYVDGEMLKTTPVVRGGPKVGRNDPCPCGSGKKYKKCCGK